MSKIGEWYRERRRQYALCDESAERIRGIVYRRDMHGENITKELEAQLEVERKFLSDGRVDPERMERILKEAQVSPIQFWLPM